MAYLRPIRILFFHPTYSFGGAERTSKNLLASMNPEEFRIVLVSSQEIAQRLKSPVVEKVIYIEELKLGVWVEGVSALIRDARIAARLLKEENPDIAFAMMHYASTFLTLAKRLSFYRGLIVSSPRGPSTDYIKTCFSSRKDKLFLRLLFRLFCRYSDFLVVPSKGTGEDCVKNFSAKPNRVKVIYNSVDTDAVRAKAMEALNIGIPLDLPIVASAGRLTKEKNLPLLFRAFAIVKERMKARLLIIGEGQERENLEELARKLNIISDVLFVGFQDNPHKYMKRACVYVHTCLVEGFGNVIVEAMACGLPVIATDCPYGPGEIISHLKNGLLITMDDRDALADAILTTLQDERLRKSLSEGAIERAQEFSIRRMTEEYELFFKEIMGDSRSLEV